MMSCSRVLVAICQICYDAGNWIALNENIGLLVKRRSQLKYAVTKMVQECCTYIDHTPDKAQKLKLIETLRQVTEGKIYVEVERARLTKILADIKEKDGNVIEAATIMEELQVETYGTMERREKVELILEQMRLCLLKQDFVRTQIIAKKISIKFFDDPMNVDLKYKYYKLMILLDQDSSFLKTSRHYQSLLAEKTVEPVEPVPDKDTKTDKKIDAKAGGEPSASTAEKMEVEESVEQKEPPKVLTEEERKEKMVSAIVYCILASFDNEQCDMMEHLSKMKILEEIPVYKEILRLFMCKEIINYEMFSAQFGEHLSQCEMFDKATKHGSKCWDELHDRLIEHNIRVIANYYTRLNLKRLEELLNLPGSRCEEYLSKLANAGTIQVKIDRPLGIVHFTQSKNPSDILNSWSHNITDLMNLVNKTCHLISKEEATHENVLKN